MAYPLEQEQFEYKQYVIDTQSQGGESMTFEDWLAMRKQAMNPGQGMGAAIDDGLGYAPTEQSV